MNYVFVKILSHSSHSYPRIMLKSSKLLVSYLYLSIFNHVQLPLTITELIEKVLIVLRHLLLGFLCLLLLASFGNTFLFVCRSGFYNAIDEKTERDSTTAYWGHCRFLKITESGKCGRKKSSKFMSKNCTFRFLCRQEKR